MRGFSGLAHNNTTLESKNPVQDDQLRSRSRKVTKTSTGIAVAVLPKTYTKTQLPYFHCRLNC